MLIGTIILCELMITRKKKLLYKIEYTRYREKLSRCSEVKKKNLPLPPFESNIRCSEIRPRYNEYQIRCSEGI